VQQQQQHRESTTCLVDLGTQSSARLVEHFPRCGQLLFEQRDAASDVVQLPLRVLLLAIEVADELRLLHHAATELLDFRA
jgi:hypothetical protein